MIHIHVFNAVVVLPHESRHANRTFLRVLRVTNGKIKKKIPTVCLHILCVPHFPFLFLKKHTLNASSEPVRGGGPTRYCRCTWRARGRRPGRIPNTDAVFASRPLAWRPLPFCRGGTGSGRQWRAGPAVSVSWWPPRRPDTGAVCHLLTCLLPTPHRRLGLAEAGDKRAWDSLRVDSATARDLRWRDDVRGSGVLCDCDRLTV